MNAVGPRDLVIDLAPHGLEAAIDAGHHTFSPEHRSVAHDALRYGFRVFDDVARESMTPGQWCTSGTGAVSTAAPSNFWYEW